MRAARLVALAALISTAASASPPVTTPASLPPQPTTNAPGDLLSAPIAPASGPAQRVALGSVVAEQWWTAFDSTTLNALVARALTANNDLATADAALRQARELALAAGGAAWPQIDASYQAQRAQVAGVVATPLADPNANLYTLHTAQITVSYPIDIFGGVHSKTRSAQAAALAQQYRRDAARNTVVANLVQAVIQNASLVAQIDAAKENITANREVLAMLRRRQQLGVAGAADVVAQEAALATAEATLPPLDRARVHQQALISALLGVAPGNDLPALPSLDDLALPAELPLALPSEIVARRPDVRAAGAVMEGAGADVRTAIAARLPSFTLGADVGGAANRFADMFASGNPFWALMGTIAGPIFHGGALRHQQHASEAALDGAKAQYRAAVLQAFTDVSDALTALKTDADVLDAAGRGDRASATSLAFTRRQLELGAAGTFNMLNAEAARAQAHALLIAAMAARLSDTVAFFQAVGGPQTVR